jgi:hypothetical protein
MSARDDRDFERTVRTAFARLAPAPGHGTLERTMAAVAETPQRRGIAAWAARGNGWAWAAVTGALVAGVAAGIAIGVSLAPSVPPGSSDTPSPVGSSVGVATPAPAPSSPGPTPPAVAPEGYERIDLPDPAPGVFSSTGPVGVVAFDGGYVAAGYLDAHCASDIYETPPGCAEALEEVASPQTGLVWLSADGRSWELLDHQPSLEGARIFHLATDGRVLVATGVIVQPGELHPVVWVSDDGRDWELVDSEGPVPGHVVGTANGFIGAMPADAGPQFLASDDGRAWQPLTDAGDAGPGEVMGMAVGRDGTTVLAVGVTYVYTDDRTELLSITATSWLSHDGLAWERGQENDGHEGAWMSAATQTDDGWVAVGLDQTTEDEPSDEMAAWTSPDGLAWTRIPRSSIDLATIGYADQVAWTGSSLVATGSVAGEGGSGMRVWLSADGSSWQAMEDEPGLVGGIVTRLLALDGLVMGVGSRSTDPDHSIGVVWLIAPD